MNKKEFINLVDRELIQKSDIKSIHPYEPIQVFECPKDWTCIGTGNYAAVFVYKHDNNFVVKVYAEGREGIEEETEVYKRLGEHPSYSTLIHRGANYLYFKRIKGITLYNALIKGERISKQVIKDINIALMYAREKGLNPVDVHGKNVMMYKGRGYVVDVSDFLKEKRDTKWRDLERAYNKIYLKTLYKHPIPVPSFILNLVRRSYRNFKQFTSLFNKWAVKN